MTISVSWHVHMYVHMYLDPNIILLNVMCKNTLKLISGSHAKVHPSTIKYNYIADLAK